MPEPVWLVSVHDVMPDTLSPVKRIVDELDRHGVAPLTLLVVPGGPWVAEDIDWLRARQARGDRLAGHGWVHRAGPPRGLYDRLHRRFFSRGVAEHLPLDAAGIAQTIGRCHEWFVANGLEPPALYVPPAWAMGRIERERLRTLPFDQYETLSGVFDAKHNAFRRIPLLGFEADTRFRALVLRLSNAVNRGAARLSGRLRVSIHPHDPDLLLSRDLNRLISRPATCAAYG